MTEFTSKYAATKHGDVIVCATPARLHARLRTAPIPSRERQRAAAGRPVRYLQSRKDDKEAMPG